MDTKIVKAEKDFTKETDKAISAAEDGASVSRELY